MEEILKLFRLERLSLEGSQISNADCFINCRIKEVLLPEHIRKAEQAKQAAQAKRAELEKQAEQAKRAERQQQAEWQQQADMEKQAAASFWKKAFRKREPGESWGLPYPFNRQRGSRTSILMCCMISTLPCGNPTEGHTEMWRTILSS